VLDRLAEIDRALFYAVNHGEQNALFDRVMPFVTSEGNWRVPILLVWLGLLVFGKSRGRAAAMLVIPLLALSDQASSHLIKHTIMRLRPCNVLPDVHLLVGCSHSYSMPSSHAANFGAAAFHFAFFYPRWAPAFVCLMLLVGYTRIYCGVHYPFDVLVGFLVGLGAALAIRGLYRAGRGLVARRRARGAVTSQA
jgi:undecaprenyl-diphosphatase